MHYLIRYTTSVISNSGIAINDFMHEISRAIVNLFKSDVFFDVRKEMGYAKIQKEVKRQLSNIQSIIKRRSELLKKITELYDEIDYDYLVNTSVDLTPEEIQRAIEAIYSNNAKEVEVIAENFGKKVRNYKIHFE